MQRLHSKSALFLTGAAVWAITSLPAQAQLPDIRGLNFAPVDNAFSGVTDFGGTAQTPFGPISDEFNPTSEPDYFGARPHTFDIIADPGAPNDPSRVQINTRLVNYSTLYGAMNPDITFDLIGSYNQSTGALHVSGSKIGPVFFYVGTGLDDAGIFAFDTTVFLELDNPMLSLNGTVESVPGGLVIAGSDLKPAPGQPGNITADAFAVLYTPAGTLAPTSANTLLTLNVIPGTGYGAFYNWTATTVPEPGGLALLIGMGLSAVGLLARRRRDRAANH